MATNPTPHEHNPWCTIDRCTLDGAGADEAMMATNGTSPTRYDRPVTVMANGREYTVTPIDPGTDGGRETHGVERNGVACGLLNITGDVAGLDVWVRTYDENWRAGYWNVSVAVEAIDRHVQACDACSVG